MIYHLCYELNIHRVVLKKPQKLSSICFDGHSSLVHCPILISCYCLSFVTVTNQLLLCVTLHEASTSGFAVVPYIRRAVQPIKQTQASLMILIKIDQKPLLNTGHIFPMPKDNIPKVKRTDYDSVFSVPCKVCKHVCIGKTKRQFKGAPKKISYVGT